MERRSDLPYLSQALINVLKSRRVQLAKPLFINFSFSACSAAVRGGASSSSSLSALSLDAVLSLDSALASLFSAASAAFFAAFSYFFYSRSQYNNHNTSIYTSIVTTAYHIITSQQQ
jgi:hypothetical protein